MSKIVKHKGVWCIQESFPQYDKPEMIVLHWPIGLASPGGHVKSHEGAEVSRGGCSYEYTLRIAPYEYVRIYLKDQGKTESIDTITEPIPCPKVRKGIETRYRNGVWEKELKSGWITA